MRDRTKTVLRLALAGLAGLILLAAAGKDLLRTVDPELVTSLKVRVLDLVDPLPFELVESSTRTGVTHLHRTEAPHPTLANLAPWLMSLSASVAVVDYDNDGWRDIYLTDSAGLSKNRLFRNNGDGTFTDVAERAGVADLNRDAGSVRALFFDYDNDGDKDLLLTTNLYAKFLRNKGDGTFEDVTKRSGLRHKGLAPASNVFDYDLDGDLDVIMGNYFEPVDFQDPHTYLIMQSDNEYADNGGRASVYRNNGDGTFSPAPGNLGVETPRWITTIGVYDISGDGWTDVHFAGDYNPECLYINDGKGKLLNASAALTDNDGMNNMNSIWADPFNRGETMLFVSNAYLPPHELDGNVLWRVEEGGDFEDLAPELGVERCGYAWGAVFLDLDNDRLQDLVVINGYISADPDKEYRVGTEYFLGMKGGMADARNWPAMGDSSMFGHQESCVYYNRGRRFSDVVKRTGMRGDLRDGRGLAAIDYLNNGSLSLVAANQNQESRFYHNEQRNGNEWIGFELEGTRSNRDGFGAEVKVRLEDGTVMRRQSRPTNGFMAQSDDRLHFGLGRDPAIEEVTVRWPAGGKQTLKGLRPGRYHKVTEPR